MHRDALQTHGHRLAQALADSLSRQGNTIHSGRRVLRSGGPNHSKSLVFIVFLSGIELGLANPPSTHPLGLGGCLPPPGCGLQHHDKGAWMGCTVYVGRTLGFFDSFPFFRIERSP